MDVAEVSGSKPSITATGDVVEGEKSDKDQIRVKRKSLQAVLEQCQRALELLSNAGCDDEDDDANEDEGSTEGSSSPYRDRETDELCDLLKSRVECPDFLQKLETAQVTVPQNVIEECSSWDVVSETDIWDGENTENQEDYVLVRQEDIVEGIACFMAAYLLSLKQTKAPNIPLEQLGLLSPLNEWKPKSRGHQCVAAKSVRKGGHWLGGVLTRDLQVKLTTLILWGILRVGGSLLVAAMAAAGAWERGLGEQNKVTSEWSGISHRYLHSFLWFRTPVFEYGESISSPMDLTPNQLQEALSKTFCVKKKKGKLRKAWDGGRVIYNVASWGATAIGIYQNPAILRAASAVFWTSCRVISKLF
ncbi:hypothetical protein RJ641_031590 [Dillenia turbinata]|uniref:Uncharacterized protein n=1 Tax=Dillenia turbinata TaxID=194707 RepID=A0AAN8W2W6_9MAGN